MKQINRRRFIISSLAVGTALTAGPISKVTGATLGAETRMAIYKDMTKCVNCVLCSNACNQLNGLTAEYAYLEIIPFDKDGIRHRKRLSCVHCKDAACIRACPTGSLYKGSTGFTHINRDTCIGCEYCMQVCPYKIIKMRENKVSKCDGCEKLLYQGQEPRCVEVCPLEALYYGPWDEMLERARADGERMLRAYPAVQVYGDTQLGGLGLIQLLGNTPQAYGKPVNPKTSAMLGWWKDILQPGGLAIAGIASAAALISFGIAKRNYQQEKEGDKGGKSDE